MGQNEPGKEVRGDLQGVEYIAAIPARKSRARPLPPVAEAAYGPYAAIILEVSLEILCCQRKNSLIDGRHVD